MSEFCEHIEEDEIGWRTLAYEEARAIHKRGCDICRAERERKKEAPEVRWTDLPAGTRFAYLLLLATLICYLFWGCAPAPTDPGPHLVRLTVKVQRANTFEPLTATVNVHDLTTGGVSGGYTFSPDGYYTQGVVVGHHLSLSITREGCTPGRAELEVPGFDVATTVNLGCS